VVVFPADRALWSSARRVQSTRPATDGRFSFRDLPAGTYLIAALTDVEPGEWTTAAFLEALMPAAVPVALADGETKRQDLRVARMTQGF
jgi:tellurite resistance protein